MPYFAPRRATNVFPLSRAALGLRSGALQQPAAWRGLGRRWHRSRLLEASFGSLKAAATERTGLLSPRLGLLCCPPRRGSTRSQQVCNGSIPTGYERRLQGRRHPLAPSPAAALPALPAAALPRPPFRPAFTNRSAAAVSTSLTAAAPAQQPNRAAVVRHLASPSRHYGCGNRRGETDLMQLGNSMVRHMHIARGTGTGQRLHL